MSAAWANGTRETYGSGLLIFHVFCDQRGVPEEERCPAHPTLILAFISACAGSYSGSALANILFGVQAWHTLHGQPWAASKAEIQAALTGGKARAPASSKNPKRDLFTTDLIERLRTQLDLTAPLDAAVFACLTVAFWSTARLGEFVLGNLTSFVAAEHVKRSDVRSTTDRADNPVTVIFVPKTKCSATGEDLYYAPQVGPCDPVAAMSNHLHINDLPQDTHLFGYTHEGQPRPMTRTAFTRRLNRAACALGTITLHFHGIHIGSVLEYMLRGVPLEVVKRMGRWSSEAFTVYLREHAVVLAPYLQDSPAFVPFNQAILPPVR
ncbi:hypothetical protein D9615_001776 [Tricholomella constricta]|uniref:Tyr recombinase domain-containing protein n=1 Tax=Tricholomella constricta TaxID=117010 RepID=A0A8H5HPA2_9AGAR|nr:hypothetical protein D9615_001776 [Tricholomella constricta]